MCFPLPDQVNSCISPDFEPPKGLRIDVARLHGGVDVRIIVRIANGDLNVSAVAFHVLVPGDRAHLQLTAAEAYDDVRSGRHFDDRTKVAVRGVLDLHSCVAAINRNVNFGGPRGAAHGDANVIIRCGLDLISSAIEVKVDLSISDKRLVSHRSWCRFGRRFRRRALLVAARRQTQDRCNNENSRKSLIARLRLHE